MKKYQSFAQFYPYYLSEHQNVTCRRLHFAGSCLGLLCIVASIVFAYPGMLLIALISGYSFAWVGHFFFEHNKPATFRYPFYSFIGDWLMFWQVLNGQVSLRK